MNREIKFRAWDSKSKRMFDPNNEAQTFGWYAAGKDPDVTLLQYTGLKDKNGKEIYEGDIVLNGLSGTWIIQPLQRGSMSLLGICKKYKDSNYDISALNSQVEIIGNIYENPELI